MAKPLTAGQWSQGAVWGCGKQGWPVCPDPSQTQVIIRLRSVQVAVSITFRNIPVLVSSLTFDTVLRIET